VFKQLLCEEFQCPHALLLIHQRIHL
jgi:hypothetical protein